MNSCRPMPAVVLAATMAEAGETLHHDGFRVGPLLEISIRREERLDQPAAMPGVTGGRQPPLEPPSPMRKAGRRTILSGNGDRRRALPARPGTAGRACHTRGRISASVSTGWRGSLLDPRQLARYAAGFHTAGPL